MAKRETHKDARGKPLPPAPAPREPRKVGTSMPKPNPKNDCKPGR